MFSLSTEYFYTLFGSGVLFLTFQVFGLEKNKQTKNKYNFSHDKTSKT